MKCKRCGNEIKEDSLYCDKCGKRVKKHRIPIILIVISSIVIIIVSITVLNYTKKDIKVKIHSILTSEKIISELSVLKVPHGDVIKKEDKNGNIIQRIAYRGSIELGINFKDILVGWADDTNTIIIKIPKISVMNPYVDTEKIYVIPKKNTNYDDKNSERINECTVHMRKQFEDNKDVIKIANENAKDTVKNFIGPIIKEMDPSCDIIIKVDGEE